MTDQFDRTAVKLSQGPLGIIALFIVLIHGFASLVLGLADDSLAERDRSILVWFLVLFPVGVFGVFAWLVSTHHANLYPPQAFQNEEHFFNLAYGRASFDERTSRSQPEPAAAPPRVINTAATGSLYWLGHDLMWTADTLLRGGPREQVLIGLDQSLHHLGQVKLGSTPIEADILQLHDRIRQAKELPSLLRDEYANQLGSVIDRIGATAEAAQANFQVPPHWTRIREKTHPA